MRTKIITPADVTPEILRAGIESNETAKNKPSRFQLNDSMTDEQWGVEGLVDYSVKFNDGWNYICDVSTAEVAGAMIADSDDDTIWTTPIQETAQ